MRTKICTVERSSHARWCHKVGTPHKVVIRRAHAVHLTALCYYSRPRSICKYPKPPIFGRKIRDNIHKEENLSDFNGEFCHICRFSKMGSKSRKKILEKGLDKVLLAWYNIRAMKQSVPRSHPAATERAWLIVRIPPRGCFRAECLLRAIFISPERSGNGGIFLLALEKIC